VRFTIHQHPHRAAAPAIKPKHRPARLLTLFVLCLCADWGTSASAQTGGCTTPSFGAPVAYSSFGATISVAVADFDGDGKLDLGALNSYNFGSLYVFRGSGTGAFQLTDAFSDIGSSPRGIAAGDFNGDGRPDIVTANGSFSQGEASVYLNNNLNNNLTFNEEHQLNWAGPGGTSASSVAVADFNADGKLDLVLSNISTNSADIALGDGAGHFTNFQRFNSGGIAPSHVVVRDFNGDGKLDLAVANSGSGGSNNNVGILLGNGDGGFSPTISYPGGASPTFLATGDFNSDNKPDLAVASGSTNEGPKVSILLNDGAGAFGPPSSFLSGGMTTLSLSAADFNGDGKIDLAVANRLQSNVQLFVGDGAGNFTPSSSYNSGASGPNFITASDLNGDSLPDLVVAHEGPRRVSVLLNTCGAGSSEATLGFSAASYAVSEAVSTVTVTVNRSGSLAGATSVNYATSDGVATNPADYRATSGVLSFADGEASKTFTVEIVNDTGDEPSETFIVTLSNPTGSATLGTLSAATVNIFDDDPTPSLSVNDVSVTEGNSGLTSAVFTVTLSAASGQQVRVNYATSDAAATNGVDYVDASGTLIFMPGQTTRTVAVSVIGDTDAEVSESFFFTLSSSSNATLTDAQAIGTILDDDAACPNPTFGAATNVDAPWPSQLVSGDFNGDGKSDVATADSTSESINVRLGDGAGGFSAAASFPVGKSPRSLALGDFNLDGKTDIVVASQEVSGASGVSLLLADGNGGFAPATSVSTGPLPYYVAVGDFNVDGKPDLLVLSLAPGEVSVQLGDGAGGFGAPVAFFTVRNGSHDPVVADFNGDSKPDVAVSSSNSHNVSVLFGSGTGSFSRMVTLSAGENPNGLSAGDFNGDNKLDLVVANSGSNNISLLLGDGTGNFGAATNFTTGFRPIGLASADLNADGRLDVVTANYQEDSSITGDVSVLFGTGTGRFTQPTNFPTGRGPYKVIINDFNGDAKGDLVVANLLSRTLSLLLNGCVGAPAVGAIQFSANGDTLGEGDGRVAVMVTRTGNIFGVASVDYRTADTDTFTVGCSDSVNNNGGAYARCDFATVVGRLDFAVGETRKSILIPLIDDGHDETAETFQIILSNPTGAALGTAASATVTIQDNDAPGAANPILASPFFVRQQYLDFLSREPDTNGFNAWLGVLNNCPNPFTVPAAPSQCDRIYVSGEGFFRSLEFQLKGSYAFRFYKVAFDRLPEYTELVSDMSFVAGQTADEVYARKAQLATLVTQRAEFQALYGGMTNAQYVNALLGRYQLTQVTTPDPAQPDTSGKVTLTAADLTNRLNGNTLTRAQVLRAVADSDAVGAREFNNAFVGMQYYGYLRRKPDQSGFNAWLAVLQAGDVRTMVNGFLNSTEYKLRFGQP